MDVLELLLLCLECAVIGFGMAAGDWLLKIVAVKFLNSSQIQLHDVEPDGDGEDEEPPAKKAARRSKPKPRLEPRGHAPSGTPFTF